MPCGQCGERERRANRNVTFCYFFVLGGFGGSELAKNVAAAEL